MPHNSLLITPTPCEWEQEFESIQGVTRLTEEDLPRMQKMLSSCEDADCYLTSAIYYVFTGRKGLWVYERDHAFIFVCWHPNVNGQILIFPQLTNHSLDLVAELLPVMPEPTAGIRLARVKKDVADLNTSALTVTRREEDVLDWKFPVRILSTETVTAMSGKDFMYIRNRLRQLHKHSVRVMSCDAIHYSKALESLLHRWATHNAQSPEEYENLYSPYENLFSMSMEPSSNLSGFMFFVDDVLEAVSLWDVSNHTQRTANLFVNICNTQIKGLSEFLTFKCCETLQNQGIKFLNLGGSEWASLDVYKKKFCPAISVEIDSMDVEYNVKSMLPPLIERQNYA